MKDLIERLENAMGPDRELDALIELAVGKYDRLKLSPECHLEFAGIFGDKAAGIDVVGPNGGRIAYTEYPERVTGSIDAALTLVSSGAEFEVGSAYLLGVFWATVITPAERYVAKGARSPAIALCIAALKARPLASTK